MVLSISVITRDHRHLSLIWRLATTRNSKLVRFSKRSFLDQDIRETCKEIMKLLSTKDQVKCSLYILAQLAFGTTVLFSKQVEYLFLDAERASALLKQTNSDIFEMMFGSHKKSTKRKSVDDEDYKGPKRSKNAKNDDNIPSILLEDPDFNYESVPKMMVGSARAEDITLKESDYTTPQKMLIDDFGMDLTEINTQNEFNNFFNYTMDFGIETNSAAASGEKENIRNASSFAAPIEDIDLANPDVHFFAPEMNDILKSQSTPKKSYSNESWNSRRGLSPAPGLANMLLGDIDSRRNREDPVDINQEVAEMRTRSMQVDEVPFDPYQLEIEDLDPDELAVAYRTPRKTPSKKRKFDDKISHAEMREMEQDYSSLIHESAASLRVQIPKKGHLTLKQLFEPSPYYRLDKRFANELRDLYGKEEFLRPSADYTSEPESDSEDEYENANDEMNKSVQSEIDLENMKFGSTPIKVPGSLNASPQRQNPLDLLDLKIPPESPKNSEPLPNFESPSLRLEEVRGESRNSQNIDFTMNNDFTLQNSTGLDFSRKERTYINETPKKIECSRGEIREKLIKLATDSAPYPAVLNNVFQKTDGSGEAARTFYTLLEMVKERIIDVKPQQVSFEPIQFALAELDGSEDIDEEIHEEPQNEAFVQRSSD